MFAIHTWKFIADSLLKKREVMLLCVVESKGSSPGRQGFMMAVASNKKMHGTIGGGIMEEKFVELALKKLIDESTEMPKVKKQIHNKKVAKNQSGMICSGEQSIAMYHFKSTDIEVVKSIVECLSQKKNGRFTLTESSIDFSSKIPASDYSLKIVSESKFTYQEKVGFKNELYIVGAGHCSLALSKLFSDMDFRIHLYDNRENLNTLNHNTFAHQVIIVDDYSKMSKRIQSGKNKYVVIMTVGYRTDELVLKSLINNDFAYIGMLGSKAKIKKLFTQLKDENVDQEKLKKVHAPIGINIKSETTTEIAISIAAELIAVKNKIIK
jgi:xanthine dehydrogenase accessory factor